MVAAALFSSATTEWATPRPLYDQLAAAFGPFDLDAAASHDNALAPRYFTPVDDALTRNWGTGRVWLNPPYGNAEAACKPRCTKKRCAKRGWHRDTYLPGAGDFVRKARKAAEFGALVCCLLPARTDTAWWHEEVEKYASVIHFIRGRVKFVGAKSAAPFPSVVVVFGEKDGAG